MESFPSTVFFVIILAQQRARIEGEILRAVQNRKNSSERQLRVRILRFPRKNRGFGIFIIIVEQSRVSPSLLSSH